MSTELERLIDTIKMMSEEERAPILLQARMTEGDFQTADLTGDDPDKFKDMFESNLTEYIENHFNDCNDTYKQNILNLIVKQYGALYDTELNEALKSAEPKTFIGSKLRAFYVDEIKDKATRLESIAHDVTDQTLAESLHILKDEIDELINNTEKE